MMDIAFESAPPPNDESLGEVAALAEEQAIAEDRVARLTAELRYAIAHLREISDASLPDAMARLGIRSYELTDGRKVGCSDKIISGKVASPQGLAWFAAHDGGELQKVVVTIELAKGSADAARAILDHVAAAPYAKRVNRAMAEEFVHNATASSFLNDLVKNDSVVLMPEDLETVGAYRRRRAQVGPSRFKEVDLSGLILKE